ncbi:hypothetical protein C8029_15775 [Roseobacter sp. TSBP12]|nr:hypothetical protein C8029_15775 [Roseobacter sp. TSBP12]
MIERATAEAVKKTRRTKAQALRAITNDPFADLPSATLSKEIIGFRPSLSGQPHLVGNDAPPCLHLRHRRWPAMNDRVELGPDTYAVPDLM